MQRFTLELVNRDLKGPEKKVQPVPDERAIWDHVAELALTPDREPGSQIRVLNKSGGIVAHLGVTSAQRLFQTAA